MTTLTGPRRAPASGGAPKKLVVLLHGYGVDGDDLMALADPLAAALPDAEFVAPHAPDPAQTVPGGRQWFVINEPHAVAQGARDASALLDAYLDAELARAGLTGADMALVGFSQGAMMALYTGLRRADGPAAIVGFSGLLPDPQSLEAEIACKPPVFLAHGEADPVVPPEGTAMAAQLLADLGLGVAVHMTPGLPHTIAPEALQIARAMLRDAFAGELALPPGAHRVAASRREPAN